MLFRSRRSVGRQCRRPNQRPARIGRRCTECSCLRRDTLPNTARNLILERMSLTHRRAALASHNSVVPCVEKACGTQGKDSLGARRASSPESQVQRMESVVAAFEGQGAQNVERGAGATPVDWQGVHSLALWLEENRPGKQSRQIPLNR